MGWDRWNQKRLTTCTSLQRTTDNQITYAKETFNFCVSEIKGIEFTFTQKKYVNLFQVEDSFLAKCFDPTNLHHYIPGTKYFCHYTPISNGKIGAKRVSTDPQIEIIKNHAQSTQYKI